MNDPELKSTYHFQLPTELIAQQPLDERDASKLLIRQQNGQLIHEQFKNLADQIPKNTLIILNDTQVIPARLQGQTKHGGKIELFLLHRQDDDEATTWSCLGKPLKKFKAGEALKFADGLEATPVKLDHDQGEVRPFDVRFNYDDKSLRSWLDRHGQIPLPPYIQRKDPDAVQHQIDKESYQTVYAKYEGSVAAPTAGLHFSDAVLNQLRSNGCEIEHVTLHVGAGTFLPVKAENITDHVMHHESFSVPSATLEAIAAAKEAGKPVICVGTTAFRSLEALHQIAIQQGVAPQSLCDQFIKTDLFIHPQKDQACYKSWCLDGIITNFHQPESSLFMLVCALLGTSEAKATYQQAVAHKYRFFSYGDSSLLWL